MGTNLFKYTQKKTEFFSISELSIVDRETKYSRAMDLAEALYNFQHITGFRERVLAFKKDTSEGLYGEMDAAKYLFIRGLNFQFATSNNNTKFGEFDLRWFDGTEISLEVKTKEEKTGFSEKTVVRVLQDAKNN